MRTRNHLNGSMGYSLIELLVVLAIIGILVGVGAMNMGSRRVVAVRELTQQMASSFSDAQQLARATGRPVVLHVRGTRPEALGIDFEYQVPDPAAPATMITLRGGGFNAAALGGALDYAVPGIQRSQTTAAGVDMTNLRNLGLVSNWDVFFVDENAVFQGAETQSLIFASSGQISQDSFITVSNPTAGPSSPVGVVIATRRNGIHAYFISGEAGTTWRSL